MVKKLMPSPLGHALAGLAISWGADVASGLGSPKGPAGAAANPFGPLAMWCVLLAAIPDIDLLFHAHRSFTHSVTAVVLVTIFAAAVTAWVTRRRSWRVALTCGCAYATHLLLDWLAVDTHFPYGLQILWPFSRTWFISGLDLFPQTERVQLLSARTIRINLMAMAWETVILLPVVAAVGLVRVKALAGFSSKVPGGNHSSE
jgi:membrane-bound metal-dependent hydrolase YbcI (DUF457 family)